MSSLSKISFTALCINGQQVACPNTFNRCDILDRNSRYYLVLTVTPDVVLELDIEKSLTEFNYTKPVPVVQLPLLVDFKIRLGSLPTWLLPYSLAATGCVHKLLVTIQVTSRHPNYKGFISRFRSLVSPLQWNHLQHTETSALWTERCTRISTRIAKSIIFRAPNFPTFSMGDLSRLKETDSWLSDTHLAFSLMHWCRECKEKQLWGDLKIQLLDTSFWPLVTEDPSRFTQGYRNRVDLLGHDFVVMPMFERCGNSLTRNHWKLGIIEKPGEFMEGNTTFHILDSWTNKSQSRREVTELQHVLLQLAPGDFKEGRIALNHAQVPLQRNSNDCGCFAIYFAKQFFSNPAATMSLVKTPFSSVADALAGWGLTSSTMTFVRHEMRTLLFEYIDRGHATVEYEE